MTTTMRRLQQLRPHKLGLPWAAPLLAAAALLALPAFSAAPAAGAAPAGTFSVATLVVGSRSAGTGFEVEGTLQAVQQSTVSARVGGALLQLAVKPGQVVKAGQLLAQVDDRELQAGVAAGDAAVAQAQAAQRQAQQWLQRQNELRSQGFLSAAALDSATAQAQTTTAATQQAQAAQRQATLARSFATVTAPFDGVVLATHLEPGEWAAPGRPLVTLYAPGRLRAVVQLPSNRAAAARSAAAAEVLLADGRRITATARQELPGADAVAQTTEWRLELPAPLAVATQAQTAAAAGTAAGTAAAAPAGAPATVLQPGQAVRVRFTAAPAVVAARASAQASAQAPAQAPTQAPTQAPSTAAAPSPGTAPASRVTVPASAVLQRGELQAVYVAQMGRFVLKAVRLGALAGTQQEVLAGLKPGEVIAQDPVRAGLAGAVPAPPSGADNR